ncbi:alpha/beta hydrolase [Solitalea lacus]|uniref:alpha/beta hydrolase n=1 Tax=Solitalea lacus TaxID=2911172 RepID=UPI001EDB0D6C|nr:alpha/beta fold hydrolase [Solitalea lacus]UKJ06676.1 lysophospholipase [Solitalea lacus]
MTAILLYFFQNYFFYHPERLPKNFRFVYPEKFEEFEIRVPNGSYIDALLFKGRNSKGVVLYFKGNTRSIKGWSKFRTDFLNSGYDFFIFDYPGFGKSTGHPTETEIFHNTEAVYEKVKELYPEDRIIIYGRSLGSGFATRIASLNNPRLLILDSPFYSLKKLAKYYSWILPLKMILKFNVPLNEYIKDVSCPIIIFHGNRDRIIPYKFSKQLKSEFPEKIKLLTINGGKHNNLPLFDEYHLQLNEILKLLL